tara:strand:- start:2313 stop:2756 length:444 start_codon:yes stop_codon:yes gene_type:complete
MANIKIFGVDQTTNQARTITTGDVVILPKSISLAAFGPTTDIATGDGAAYMVIPDILNGFNLTRAQAVVITAGTTNATTVQVHNLTQAADMLTGLISIASAATAGTPGTIDLASDNVTTDDILRIDVDTVSTTAPKGLIVILTFDGA